MILLPRYPGAKWSPLKQHFYNPGPFLKNLIVLHIAEGSSALGTLAWFNNPASHVSAHFAIDRDGTVYQFMETHDRAWHASAVNARSVGIEHEATSDGRFPVTEAQYKASAALVAWLVKTLEISADSTHIMGHNAASPADHHVKCCEPTLDVARVIAEAASL